MSSSGQLNAKRKRLVFYKMAVVLVLALLSYLAVRHHNAVMSANRPPPDPTTWDGVPAALDAALHTQEYREGGFYVSNPNQLGNARSEQRDLYCYRLAVDFLRSLTPKQVDCFRRHESLPFAELGPPQQKALWRLYEAARSEPMTGGIDSSWISLVAVRGGRNASGNGGTWYIFGWIVSHPKGGFSTKFDLAFPAAGNMRHPPFIFPFQAVMQRRDRSKGN